MRETIYPEYSICLRKSIRALSRLAFQVNQEGGKPLPGLLIPATADVDSPSGIF